MRDALPNCWVYWFTGTPISKQDRDTVAIFGDYVSIYDIKQAVKDCATVPIYYESRLAQLQLVQETNEIDAEVDEIMEQSNN